MCTTNTKQLTINAAPNEIVAWKNYEERERESVGERERKDERELMFWL